MRVAVTSDWQFDSYPNLSKPRPSGLTSRLEDLMECWRWIHDDATHRDCEQLFVLGDLFDSRTEIELPVLSAVGTLVKESKLPVHIIPGNHDAYLRNSSITSLTALSGMATVHTMPATLHSKGWTVSFFPWHDDNSSIAKSISHEIVELKKKYGKTKLKHYAFAHLTVDGLFPGKAGVTTEDLNLRFWSQVILGDVHDPILVAPNCRYCASPLQLNFGDAGKHRGYVILDLSTGEVERIENKISPRFHTVDGKAKSSTFAFRPCDFVRVKEDADDAIIAAATECARAVGATVRNDRVELDISDIPRIQCSVGDDKAAVLNKYLDYVGIAPERRQALLDRGVRYLVEGGLL